MKTRGFVSILLCLVLTYGCKPAHWPASAEIQPQTPAVEEKSDAGRQPVEAINPMDPEWGPENGGLQTRLSALTSDFAIGKPMLLCLEVRNTGKEWGEYESSNGYDINWPYEVICPSGTRAHYTMGPAQTANSNKTVPPGSRTILFDRSDLAARYLIVEPGEYTIRWRGEVQLPPSNTLRVTVRPGHVSAWKQFAARLAPAIPRQKWWIDTYGVDTESDSPHGAVTIYTGLGGMRVTSITVWTSDTPDNGTGAPQSKRECLGHSPLGYVHVSVTAEAEARWPSFRTDIAAALDVK